MSKNYVIMARENYPGADIREICRCKGKPADIKNALLGYRELGPCGSLINKFNHVEILEIATLDKAVAQMKHPDRNIQRIFASDFVAKLQYVFEQIDALRADNGEQAAQGPAAQARPPLPIGQPEASE